MARPQLLAALGLTILAGSSAGTADECLAVLHAVCGNMTKSVASCLACDGHHQPPGLGWSLRTLQNWADNRQMPQRR